MIIGELRYPIVIKSLVTSRDPNNGSVIETWTTKYTLKAKISGGKGSKTTQNQEIFNTSTLVFTTHYRDIEDTDRIYYDGDIYKIMMQGEIGYKEGLEIIAEKIND
jgi:SPP1 family predicted phage head-tail adaptor